MRDLQEEEELRNNEYLATFILAFAHMMMMSVIATEWTGCCRRLCLQQGKKRERYIEVVNLHLYMVPCAVCNVHVGHIEKLPEVASTCTSTLYLA